MDTVKIEGKLGPDRSGKFSVEDVAELTLDLAHRTLVVIGKNGRRTEFDLGQTKGIRASNTGGNFLLEVRPNPF